MICYNPCLLFSNKVWMVNLRMWCIKGKKNIWGKIVALLRLLKFKLVYGHNIHPLLITSPTTTGRRGSECTPAAIDTSWTGCHTAEINNHAQANKYVFGPQEEDANSTQKNPQPIRSQSQEPACYEAMVLTMDTRLLVNFVNFTAVDFCLFREI